MSEPRRSGLGRCSRPAAVVVALLALVLPLASCAAPATVMASASVSALQTGTAAFINGQLESAAVVPLDRMYMIVLDTVRDLQFPVTLKSLGPRTAYVHVRESSGREIKFSMEMRSPQVTRINIRVGWWGDQAISRLLLEEIQARSPAIPPPASVAP